MLPKYHRYLRNLKLRFLPVRDEHDVPIVPGHPLFDNLTPEQRKWGRFPPWKRSNIDQIPGKFGGGMKKT